MTTLKSRKVGHQDMNSFNKLNIALFVVPDAKYIYFLVLNISASLLLFSFNYAGLMTTVHATTASQPTGKLETLLCL